MHYHSRPILTILLTSCDVSESEARGGRDCRVSSVHCKQCQTVPSLTYGQEPRVLKSLQDHGYTHGSSETSRLEYRVLVLWVTVCS